MWHNDACWDLSNSRVYHCTYFRTYDLPRLGIFFTYKFPLFCLAYATTSFLHPRIIVVATMFNKIVPTSLIICLRRILITPNMNHLLRHSPNMNHLPKLSSNPLTHLHDSRVNIILTKQYKGTKDIKQHKHPKHHQRRADKSGIVQAPRTIDRCLTSYSWCKY